MPNLNNEIFGYQLLLDDDEQTFPLGEYVAANRDDDAGTPEFRAWLDARKDR